MRSCLLLVGLTLSLGACAGDDGEIGWSDGGPDTTGEVLTVTFGPHPVPAGVESTQCVEKKLGNLDPKWISRIHTRLEATSHHLIVYRLPGTEERPEPFPCDPFVDTLRPGSGAPLMVTQIKDETLELPEGVAFGLDPDQLIRLEMHYVNAGDAESTVSATVEFHVMPEDKFREKADFLFVGNPDIDLPPGPSSLHTPWFPLPEDLADLKLFAITGHTHQWGTGVIVEALETMAGPARSIYDHPDYNWEEPPTDKLDPILLMPRGSGFRFTCSWNNLSGERVTFGEGVNDEMCFFWAYYYPSQGHKVCFHTDQAGGLDICCPGHSLCDLIVNQ